MKWISIMTMAILITSRAVKMKYIMKMTMRHQTIMVLRMAMVVQI